MRRLAGTSILCAVMLGCGGESSRDAPHADATDPAARSVLESPELPELESPELPELESPEMPELESPEMPPLGSTELPTLEGSELDPSAIERLEAARARALEALHDSSIPPAERAAATAELGRLAHAHALHDLAEAAYARARELAPGDPRWPRWAHLHAHSLRERGQAAAALEAFEAVLAARPPTPLELAARSWAGELEQSLGRLDAARAHHEAVLAADPSHAHAAWRLGLIAAEQGRHEEAVEHFEAALEAQPEASRVHRPLGLSLAALGREEDARAHFAVAGDANVVLSDPLKAAVEALRDDSWQWIERGQQAFAEGRHADAVAAFTRLVEARPDDPDAHVNLAGALARAGDAKRSTEHLRRALAIDPGHAQAQFNVGAMLVANGFDRQAVAHFATALERDPGHLDARFNLANVLRRLGRCEAALPHLASVLDVDPDRAGALQARGLCLAELDRHEEALAALDAALTAAPDEPVIQASLARFLATAPDESLRDGDRALALARRAFSADTSLDNAEVLAAAHAERGDFEEALRWIEGAIRAAKEAGNESVAHRLELDRMLYARGTPLRDE